MTIPAPEEVKVERGMVLLLERAATDVLPLRYQLWTVLSATKTGRVKLVNHSPGCIAEATATFPGSVVAEPWRVFDLSQRDFAAVWAGFYDQHGWPERTL